MGAKRWLAGCVLGFLLMGSADAVQAGTVTVLWEPSSDSRVAGYIVSYGTQSGTYTSSVRAGQVTSLSITGLTNGAFYYFAVQSYDSTNLTGPPSNEVSAQVPAVTGPTITCPSPVLTSLDGQPLAVTLTPTVTGGVTPVSTTCSPQSGSLFPVGTTSFSCTAVDAIAQKSSCTSNVVIMASTPLPPSSTPTPFTLTCPTIAPVAATGQRTTVTYADPTISGGVRPIELRCRPKSGSKFPVGQTTVECEAVDATKQIASCTTIAIVR